VDECKPLDAGGAGGASGGERERGVYPLGRAVQVDPIKPTLKVAGSQRLKLEYDEPPSNFTFKFKSRRYSLVHTARLARLRLEETDGGAHISSWLAAHLVGLGLGFRV